MSRKFQCKAIPITWIDGQARRLDCGPYLSGAAEAREILKKLPVRKDPLQDLTRGGIRGIVNPGRITRLWVKDPSQGFPFLSSTDILQSDHSNVRYISKSAANKNSQLLIKDQWTLITRSGSIGRMAFSRSDMNGKACTEDVLRVIPEKNLVKPGYLFAYLTTKFGLPIIISGTYGSIITHLEPHHIADLPVPRLGSIEIKAHEYVQQAADLRTEANQMLEDAKDDLEREIAGGDVEWNYDHPQAFSIETKTFASSAIRFDAFHHIGYVGEALKKAKVDLIEFNSIGKAHLPPFLKRIWVTEGGYEFLGGAELMTLDQRSGRYISPKLSTINRFIVKKGDVLFPCVGQRYGIYGNPVLANRSLIGKAVSQAVMRLVPADIKDSGYVSIYLATAFGHRLSMRFSAGTSIPALSENDADQTLIYWPGKKRRRELGLIAEKVWESRVLATELEDKARTLVEQAIEQGGI